MRKQRRLIAGSINHVHDDEEFDNYVLDASSRPVWDKKIDMGVQPHFVMSLVSMPDFRDEMWDEIRCHHVLEHLTELDGRHAMGEMARILVPNGILDIEVPDLDRVFSAWVNGDHQKKDLMQWIFSESLPQMQDSELNNHVWGYTEDTLRLLLEEYGFIVGDREESGLALRFRATKR